MKEKRDIVIVEWNEYEGKRRGSRDGINQKVTELEYVRTIKSPKLTKGG